MKFLEFLEQAKQDSFWRSSSAICFKGEEYPLLFFRTLFDFLKKEDVLLTSFLRTENKKQLWETLQQSFLGQKNFYWLGNILGEMRKTRKKAPDLVEILSLYGGPHTICFFVDKNHKLSQSSQKRITTINLTESVDLHDLLKICSFFDISLNTYKKDFIKNIFGQVGVISLEMACMLMQYMPVTSVRLLDSFSKNILEIIDLELSLFSLSQAFFKKQKRTFFNAWAKVEGSFSTPFWVVYWSEQVWRAYHVVKYLKQNNFVMARKFSFRLPRTFIQYDWRNCSLPDLLSAYEMLYEIDFSYKTGSTFYSLDLFYFKHFLGDFEGEKCGCENRLI